MLLMLWMLRLRWEELSYWLKVMAGMVRAPGPPGMVRPPWPRLLLPINDLPCKGPSPALRRVPTHQGLRAAHTGHAADSPDFILHRVLVSCLCCHQVKLCMGDEGWSPVDVCGLSVGGWAQGPSWDGVLSKGSFPNKKVCSNMSFFQKPLTLPPLTFGIFEALFSLFPKLFNKNFKKKF